MDWKNPAEASSISIAIAYLEATGTSKGLLTSNPGGPGRPAGPFTEALSLEQADAAPDYDLLGFDPRGFGASTNGRSCLTTTAKLKKLPEGRRPPGAQPATHAMEVAEAKLFGEACASHPLARYVNTQQTVWDLDFLRQLLGQEQAAPTTSSTTSATPTAPGWVPGTPTPTRRSVGRFILDSNMQWTTTMYANQPLDSSSFQRRRDKMLFPYLARHNTDFGLGKSAKSVKKKYESTRKKLATQAKKDLKKGRTPVIGPEDLDYIVASLIYSDEGFASAGYIIDAGRGLRQEAVLARSTADAAEADQGAR